MPALLQIVILTAATFVAGAVALTLYWVCLEAAFQILHPQRTQVAPSQAGLSRGTLGVIRAFTGRH